MKQTFLTVVIPTLNEEYFLPNLLFDLTEQKDKNFEVIVVDADSEDGTKTVAESFKHNLKLRYYCVHKKGVSYQRNFGAKKAKGDYILFIDADSRIDNKFIKKFNTYYKKYNTKIVMPFLIPDRRDIHINLIFKFVRSYVKASQSFSRPLSTGGSFFIQKKLFENMGGFDEKLFFSEDNDLIRRIYKKGIRPYLFDNLQIIMSLRRMDKEGQLSFAYRNLVASYFNMKVDKITFKIFDYEMGGQRYFIQGKNKVISSLKGYDSKIRNISSSINPVLSPIQRVSKAYIPTVSYYRSKPGRYIFNVMLLFTMLSMNFMFATGGALKNVEVNKETISEKLNDYKKYEKIIVTNVVNPVKNIYLRNLYLGTGESSNKYTTGFFSS